MRLKAKDKINKYIKRIGLSESATALLMSFIRDSRNAIIPNFTSEEYKYIDSIFDGSKDNYLLVLKVLINKDLVSFNYDQNTLVIVSLYSHHINNLLYNFNSKKQKRSYLKDPFKKQQSIFSILSSGSLGKIVATAAEKISETTQILSFNYKESGFKVYESIMPYLTGEPLSGQEKEVLLKRNPELLSLEEYRRNLSKESKRVLCALLSFMDENGVIEDCTEHSLLQSVLKEFGSESFCSSTWYISSYNLRKAKLITKFYDKEKDCPCIKVNCINTGERYVIVPFIPLVDKDFKKLEAASVKIFFELLFLLNNGETKRDGKIEFTGQSKAVYYKIDKLETEKKENKSKFEKKLLQLKKRFPNEIRKALFGDCVNQDSDFKALSKYFHFKYLSGTSLMVRIKQEYYISKKAEILKKQLNVLERHKRKVQIIKGFLDDYKVDFTHEEMLDFIKVFRRVNKKVTKLILGLLAERINKVKEGWDNIVSKGAYVRRLYQKYQDGSLVET